jgi:hypothetical protein
MQLRPPTARFSAWAILTVVIFCASDAWSRVGATLVALVTTDPGAELSHRVEEQLEALGFDVVVLNPPATGAAGPASLEQAARNVGAIAAVRIVPMAQSVQVWTADPVTGQTVFRELVTPAGQRPSDASVALGAVELLRASLLELHPPEPLHPKEKEAPPAPCPPPPPVPAEKPKEPLLGVAAGVGLDFGLAGRPAASLQMAIWLKLAGRFGARAIALASVSSGKVAAAQYGDIAFDEQLYGAELTYDFTGASSAFVPVVGLGIGAANVTVRGLATSGGVNLDENTWVGLPFGHVGGSWAPTPGLRLRGDALGGVSVPAATVCVQQGSQCADEVARWGQPFVTVALALEVLLAP